MRVAIVGIGIHRFGRTEGVSGRAQGALAARAALADACAGRTSSSPSVAATPPVTPTHSSLIWG